MCLHVLYWLASIASLLPFVESAGSAPLLILYKDRALNGAAKQLTGPKPNFQKMGFNDVVSSVAAAHGNWELYTDAHYKGSRTVVKEGETFDDVPENDNYSSAKPICTYVKNPTVARVKVWEHIDMTGAGKMFYVDVADLETWGGRISSVYTVQGDWEFYENENYEGRRELVTQGRKVNVQGSDLYKSLRPLCSSYSAAIPQLVLYADSGFRGKSKTLLSPTSDFQDIRFNDVVSSVSAITGDWELYTNKEYSGTRALVTEGHMSDASNGDQYSSARPVCSYSRDPAVALLTVWEDSNQGGDVRDFYLDQPNLDNVQWNDKISSVSAVKGDWELYGNKQFQGKREVVREGQQINVDMNDAHSSLRPIC